MLLSDIINFNKKMDNLVKVTVDNSVQVITNSAVELGDDIDTETNGKGRKFTSRFIEAGIAHYNELGNILITKETLDKFLNTMVGCPVVILHKTITDNNADKERVGVISDVWYNNKDGWFYCSGIIWDKKAIDLIKNQGWNVSCTYEYTSDFTPRDYNGGQIDMEFTDGKFLYLALVDNPRYSGANIVINSKDIVNNDKWITVKPNGEENKGRHLLLEGNETPKEAMERQWGIDFDKKEKNIKPAPVPQYPKHDRPQQEIKEKQEDTITEHYNSKFKEYKKNYEKIKNMDIQELINFRSELSHIITDLSEKYYKDKKNKNLEKIFYKFRNFSDELERETLYRLKNVNNSTNRKDNLIMAVMDELKQFIVNIVNNECDKDKKADNEKVDKRDIIRQIMAIAGKKEDDEDVRTIAKLAEKLAYDESEAGTADNEDEVDKRELIREIMAIVGKYAPKEIVETVAKKAEKLGYEKSEAGTADNKCKNEDDEEDKEEYKKAKEIADNKKVDNANDIANKITEAIMGGTSEFKTVPEYVSRDERLKLGDNY